MQVVRGALRHVQRLHVAALAVAAARRRRRVDGLRPPVFFRHKPAFERALRLWRPEMLEAAGAALLEAERRTKTTGLPRCRRRAGGGAVLARRAAARGGARIGALTVGGRSFGRYVALEQAEQTVELVEVAVADHHLPALALCLIADPQAELGRSARVPAPRSPGRARLAARSGAAGLGLAAASASVWRTLRSAGHDLHGEPDRVRGGQQGAGMAGGQRALAQQVAHPSGRPSRRSVLATWLRLLPTAWPSDFLRQAEFVEQAAVALGLLERVEILALQVLDQAGGHGLAVVEFADDDRHLVQLAPPARRASGARRR